ncbi:MAG: recombinase family protein [Clostridia bacterium]|nr:recombinase family protein [Clostridia bacterium]
MEKYAMYLRKSQFDKDYENLTVEETLKRHQSILNKLAKERKYYIVKVYDEVVSGESISARPKVQELLNDVGQNMYDGVLVIDVDRLARGNSVDQGIISQTFQFTGTKIITPTKTYDPLNEFDEEYFEFGLFMSRREYKTITRRLIRGRKISASEGKYVGGTAPYGYKTKKIEKEKGFTLEIIPEEAEVVRKMFELFLQGNGAAKIANFLNKAGTPTKYNAKYWTFSTILKILNNPVYIGKIKMGQQLETKTIENGVVIKHRKYVKDIEDLQLYDGLHEPIISDDVFYQAQRLIKQKAADTPVKENVTLQNAFAGLLFCKKCNRAFRRTTHKVKNGKRERLICTMTGVCDNTSADYERVEEILLKTIRTWYESLLISAEQDNESVIRCSELQKQIDKIDKDIENINFKLDKIYDFLEKEIYSIDEFQKRKKALDQEAQNLVTEKSSLVDEMNFFKNKNKRVLYLIPKIENIINNYYSYDRATQNSLLKEVLEKILYYREPNSEIKIELFPRFNIF